MQLVPEQRFKVLTPKGYEDHRIDQGGNHFIGKRCVNPKGQEYITHSDDVYRDAQIGDSYPKSNVKRYPSVIKSN
jgi:hypothetical protein